jgi:hypothetical protein
MDSEMIEQAFAMLCQKYVQRSDERQAEMGLQYTTAETHELAKTIAAFVARTPDPAIVKPQARLGDHE